MTLEFYPDKGGKWRARITADNGEIIFASHQGFSSKQACENNLRLVRAALTGEAWESRS